MDREGCCRFPTTFRPVTLRLAAILGLALLALAPDGAIAQAVTGNLQGRILEQSGDPVPGMSVTVEGRDLQGQRTGITDKDGFFQVLALPPGTYSVRLERVGLRTLLVREVEVALGRTANLGELRTAIVPVALAALEIVAGEVNIDPVSTSVGATLKAKDFAMLPTQGISSPCLRRCPTSPRATGGTSRTLPGRRGRIRHTTSTA